MNFSNTSRNTKLDICKAEPDLSQHMSHRPQVQSYWGLRHSSGKSTNCLQRVHSNKELDFIVSWTKGGPLWDYLNVFLEE